jgi:hypothetical protein
VVQLPPSAPVHALPQARRSMLLLRRLPRRPTSPPEQDLSQRAASDMLWCQRSTHVEPAPCTASVAPERATRRARRH